MFYFSRATGIKTETGDGTSSYLSVWFAGTEAYFCLFLRKESD